MSAARLREAAKVLRDRDDSFFELAVADWLDAEAQDQDHDPSEHDGSPSGYALRVADAILGGDR